MKQSKLIPKYQLGTFFQKYFPKSSKGINFIKSNIFKESENDESEQESESKFEELYKDVSETINNSPDIDYFLKTAWNGIQQRFNQHFDSMSNEELTKLQERQLTNQKKNQNKYNQSKKLISKSNKVQYPPTVVLSDTLNSPRWQTPGRYILNEDLLINGNKFRIHNRHTQYDNNGNPTGNMNDSPVHNTRGLVIHSYNPFFQYGHPALQGQLNNRSNWNYYYGIDKDGNFVHGSDYSKFNKGDLLTRTMRHPVTEIYVKGTNQYGHPQVRMKTLTGDYPINFMPSNWKLERVGGIGSKGSELLVAGNEVRNVTGTASDLNNAIKQLQSRHPNEQVYLVEQDNGSYSEGLRTRNRELTEQDFRNYHSQNTINGHGLILM